MWKMLYFLLDPIDNLNKLYTQRQRWQRGEIEVAHMFFLKEDYSIRGFFKSPMMLLLLFDHTFVFPRDDMVCCINLFNIFRVSY